MPKQGRHILMYSFDILHYISGVERYMNMKICDPGKCIGAARDPMTGLIFMQSHLGQSHTDIPGDFTPAI